MRFQCAIGGNPRPKVTWDKDNVAFKSENQLDHIHIEEHNDTRIIEIRNIVPEVIRFQMITFIFLILVFMQWLINFILKDAGLYRITVENELGRIQANARLDVLARSSSRSSSGFIRSGSASSYGKNTYYPGIQTLSYGFHLNRVNLSFNWLVQVCWRLQGWQVAVSEVSVPAVISAAVPRRALEAPSKNLKIIWISFKIRVK